MNIGVIGIGKLGLSFSLLAERKGINVLGSDKNQSYVDMINSKELKSLEPKVEDYLKESKKLRVTIDNIEVIKNSDIIFTFVQTPSSEKGEYIHDNIEEIINDFKTINTNDVNLKGKVFVIGCTTMPGYVDTVYDRLKGLGVHVCYNPEFIAQGEIIKGLEYADIVLIGSSSDYASVRLVEFYTKIMSIEPNINLMSNTAAEITKISINCFLTTKISFANMIGEICIDSGVGDEVKDVLKAIGEDSRVGKKYLNYGFGFGGPCLPRDNRALGNHMDKIGLKINLPHEVDKFNVGHNKFLSRVITKNVDPDTTFIFNTISYKNGIDIITESQQLKLAITLLEMGYKVFINDDNRVINLVSKDLTTKFGDKVTFSDNNNYPYGIIVDL